jgi:proline iminopeptidase
MVKLNICKFLLFALFLASCNKKSVLENHEGFIAVKGGKIWYQVVGNGSKAPLLILHGGPGVPSYYLNPLKELSKERPIIFFDQLGCGRSDKISDTTLMNIDAYVDQTKKLLEHLNVKQFYLYGHSWGSMLGADFYFKHSEGIKGLIFASPCLNSKFWVADADTLLTSLPDSVETILRAEIKGETENAYKLREAIKIYYQNFYTRKQSMSPYLDSATLTIGLNVYQHMWGQNEFIVTGSLKSYDCTSLLKNIEVPTLYYGGVRCSKT